MALNAMQPKRCVPSRIPASALINFGPALFGKDCFTRNEMIKPSFLLSIQASARPGMVRAPAVLHCCRPWKGSYRRPPPRGAVEATPPAAAAGSLRSARLGPSLGPAPPSSPTGPACKTRPCAPGTAVTRVARSQPWPSPDS